MKGVTLDAGALIALDRDDRRVIALVCARRAGQRVVTSDPRDIARVDPDVPVVVV